jgi:hypothetical protein
MTFLVPSFAVFLKKKTTHLSCLSFQQQKREEREREPSTTPKLCTMTVLNSRFALLLVVTCTTLFDAAAFAPAVSTTTIPCDIIIYVPPCVIPWSTCLHIYSTSLLYVFNNQSCMIPNSSFIGDTGSYIIDTRQLIRDNSCL